METILLVFVLTIFNISILFRSLFDIQVNLNIVIQSVGKWQTAGLNGRSLNK